MSNKRNDIPRRGPIQFPSGEPAGINQPCLPGRVSRTRCDAVRPNDTLLLLRLGALMSLEGPRYLRRGTTRAYLFGKGSRLSQLRLLVGGPINPRCSKTRKQTRRRISMIIAQLKRKLSRYIAPLR